LRCDFDRPKASRFGDIRVLAIATLAPYAVRMAAPARLCWIAICGLVLTSRLTWGAPGKLWRISQIQFHNEVDLEETSKGILAELRRELVEGRDFQVRVYDARSEVAHLADQVDTALSRGTDLIVTMSTPALQAALQRAKGTPIVFTRCTSGVLAGAGKSMTNHAPNATGVQMVRDYDRMVGIIRQCLPNVKRIGTLVATSEINMTLNKDLLAEAAKKVGIEVVSVFVESSAQVVDAAETLMSRGIGAVCQVGGNLMTTSFASLAQVARNARIPIFAFQTDQALGGAVVTLAPEGVEVGKQTARIMLRIMRGENPGSIPMQNFTKDELFINRKAAADVGLIIPSELLNNAAEIKTPTEP
jgi:ABC-type uncharacterized transport system substrate-binding protein